jgi:lipoate-protein ligase A
MHLLDLTLPDLNANLALDEALLLEAEGGAGGEVLRLWAWPRYAVVLGAGGVIADDLDEAACAADGVPLARRASGGGTVLLGPGCLHYSLVLSTDRAPELQQITPSYRYVARVMAAALAGIQPGVELAGSSDLVAGGRKFSGNAQQRKRRFILHHGTLLHGFDLAKIGRYLRLPPRRPDYRADRPHADFLMNLPDRPAELRAALTRAWAAAAARPDWPADAVETLVREKYARDDWTRRR